MASRSLNDLLPEVAVKMKAWVAACRDRGVDVLVYCTYRTPEEQNELYAHGRTATGPIVTNAKGWQSWHNYRRAVDAVPLVNGKPLWAYRSTDERWQVMVEEAEGRGIEWAGRWQTFKEFVHFQITDNLSFAAARKELQDDGLA